ncbi:MAG TPA: AAA family ATPase [Terriglobales bacterium]|nr:AAA family ATPase [Terriglobales bacterium]
MQPAEVVRFDAFCVDLGAERLWHLDRPLPLRPKAWALLRHFLEHPGELLTKEQLIQAVWPDVAVSDDSLVKAIRELRRVLGDDSQTPRVIETVHRRGYRFIAELRQQRPAQPSRPASVVAAQANDLIVGREDEMRKLAAAYQRAAAAERQILFVSGEAGIGKTTLAQTFVEELARANGETLVVRGQCLDVHATPEPYLPLLEGLTEACHGRAAELIGEMMQRHAPSWWREIATPAASIDDGASAAAPARMLREGVHLFEALAADRVVVLLLEDLHWADTATLDFLNALAHGSKPARLWVIATFRPPQSLAADHPLHAVARELRRKQRCEELGLAPLDEDAVAAYLQRRLTGAAVAADVAALVHARSEGHPFFMIAVVDHMIERGWLSASSGEWRLAARPEEIERGVPETLQDMIEQQLAGLDGEELAVLEAGAIAGPELTSPLVAAALAMEPERVEHICAALSRQQRFLRRLGAAIWPDGTGGERYAFTHCLYRYALRERLSTAKLRQLHRRIGERLLSLFGSRAHEQASEIAAHFERGGDDLRAITHLQAEAERSNRQGAHLEAAQALAQALEVAERRGDEAGQKQQALALALALAGSWILAGGLVHAEVQPALERLRRLSEELDVVAAQSLALTGLHLSHIFRGDLDGSRAAAEGIAALAERTQFPLYQMVADLSLGWNLHYRGDQLQAQACFGRALAIDRPPLPAGNILQASGVPEMGALGRLGAAAALALLGEADQARASAAAACQRLRQLGRQADLAAAQAIASFVHCVLGDDDAVTLARAAMAVAKEHRLPQWQVYADVVADCAALAAGDLGGLGGVRDKLHSYHESGYTLGSSALWTYIAAAFLAAGEGDEAAAGLQHARNQADGTGERFWDAEIDRVDAELAMARGNAAAAEQLLRRSLRTARQQRARLFEQRTTAQLEILGSIPPPF